MKFTSIFFFLALASLPSFLWADGDCNANCINLCGSNCSNDSDCCIGICEKCCDVGGLQVSSTNFFCQYQIATQCVSTLERK